MSSVKQNILFTVVTTIQKLEFCEYFNFLFSASLCLSAIVQNELYLTKIEKSVLQL